MISKALIGCRVTHQNGGGGQYNGIIIGASSHSGGRMFFLILKPDKTFIDIDIVNAKINEEDYRKILQKEKPEPIESRLEILDL